MHDEKCALYEREMDEFKDKTAQWMNTLKLFIRQHLEASLGEASHEQIQEVLNVLAEADCDTNYSSTHVRSEIYEDLQVWLQKSNSERDNLREVCDEQMNVIKQQSKDLDRYIAQIAEVIKTVQDKEAQNRKLRAEIAEYAKIKQIHYSKESEVQGSKQKDHGALQMLDNHSQLDGIVNNEVWAQDAEISNLRRKLENSHMREKELQNQIRQLLQISQIESTQRPASRLKRFLGGQPKGAVSIPTFPSMHNLSYMGLPLLSKDRSYLSVPSSPTKSGRSSPSLAAFCDQAASTTSHQELLPGRNFSPPALPPRPRDATRHPPQDEIDCAVSSRFYQNQGQSHPMPHNVRSAASSPQPWTPGSSRQSSYDENSDQVRKFRRRFNSDPSPPEFETISSRVDQDLLHEQLINDRQPLMDHQPRVLSGITEVTEDGSSSTKRKSTNTVIDSPDSADRRAYLESVYAASALGRLQIF